MNITTKEFAVDRKVLARMLRTSYFKRYRWTYVFLGFSTVVGLLLQNIFLVILSISVGVSFLLYRYFFFERFVGDPQNAIFLQRRRYVITSEAIHCRMEDGSEAKTKLDNLLRADMIDGIYRLYVAKHQYYYIPETAFETEEGRAKFESLLKEKNLFEGASDA